MSHPPLQLVRNFTTWFCLLFILTYNIGCQNEKPLESTSHTQEKTTTNNIPSKRSELKVASWDDVQKRVKAHQGKVVVINFWLTTCGTCLEEFPHFLELQKRYGSENLVCISINGDYDGIKGKPPEYFRKQTEEFLAKQLPLGEHYLLNISCLDFMDLVDVGSTPALFIYSQDGKLAKRFDNDHAENENEEFTQEDVTKLIESLLKSEG